MSIEEAEEMLAHTIRRLYNRGLVSGVGGNASIITPGRNEIIITPSGYFKGGVEKGDLVRVSIEGKILQKGNPSSDLPTHLAIYRAREDVNAVVHGHPPIAVAMITAGIDIPAMTPEHSVLVKEIRVIDFAPPGEACAKAISAILDKDSDVIGVKNHGFFALGKDLHDAASKIEVLEETAKIYTAMRQFGIISTLSKSEIEKIRKVYVKE
jgi:Ribulose-5-phosphate 4-epimerase and related epimerases and aldolases